MEIKGNYVKSVRKNSMSMQSESILQDKNTNNKLAKLIKTLSGEVKEMLGG